MAKPSDEKIQLTDIKSPDERVEATESLDTPERIRNELMSKYNDNLRTLSNAIDNNRRIEDLQNQLNDAEKLESRRPLITVIVSLWEETPDMFTTKMFKNTLTDLVEQANSSDIYLDIIAVANNGGGANEQLGAKMVDELQRHFQEKSADLGIGETINLETCAPSITSDASTPWELDIPTQEDDKSIKSDNRLFFVNQPYSGKGGVNAGKIRSLRDVSHALSKNVTENGYAPDAIFQIDAETILEYKKPYLDKAHKQGKEIVQPLKTLFNNLTRENLIAVGTKDRLEAIDSETGKPIDSPRPSAQEGLTLTNTRERFISLPGGALLSKPENYLAAMQSMTEVTPSAGTEDYMYTQMLREQAQIDGVPFESVSKSMDLVTHLNRTPEDNREAIKQLMRWRQQALAVDKVFPHLEPYHSDNILRYSWLVLSQRIKDSWKGKRADYLTQVFKDLSVLPEAIGLLSDQEAADILKGSASWGHSNN